MSTTTTFDLISFAESSFLEKEKDGYIQSLEQEIRRLKEKLEGVVSTKKKVVEREDIFDVLKTSLEKHSILDERSMIEENNRLKEENEKLKRRIEVIQKTSYVERITVIDENNRLKEENEKLKKKKVQTVRSRRDRDSSEESDESDEENNTLNGLILSDLKQLCRDHCISGFSTLNKDELIKHIKSNYDFLTISDLRDIIKILDLNSLMKSVKGVVPSKANKQELVSFLKSYS